MESGIDAARIALRVALCALSSAACSFGAAEPAARYRCDPGESCPPGTSCGPDHYCSGQSDAGAGAIDAGICHGGAIAGATRIAPSTTDFDDWAPAVSADDREIFIFRPDVDVEIWRAERDSAASDFAEAERALPQESGAQDRDPLPTQDGLALLFASTRDGGQGGHDLWIARRRGPLEPFDMLERLAVVNSPADDRSPWLSDDGTRLYFTSNRSGQFDIYRAERATGDGAFGEPHLVGELSSDNDDRWIRLTADEREAFVTSDRPVGAGKHDIYVCPRGEDSAVFGSCQNLEELNTSYDDVAAAPSRDGSALYLNLDTELSGGRNAEVWLARRDCGE